MSQNATDISQAALSEPQVAEFLAAHPDFFSRHLHLLAELHVPHNSAPAVSLVERQTSLLRDKNRALNTRLGELIDIARHNDLKFDKTRRLVLALLEASSLDDVAVALDESLCEDFNGDQAVLLLFHEAARGSNGVRCCPREEAAVIDALVSSNLASCGQLGEPQNRFIFGEAALKVQSAAVVPLVKGETLGLLAIGSYDAHYFQSSQGTLLLSYVGEVLSRVIARILPPE